MSITRALAQATGTELERAENWYAMLFDRPPDARPMDGLIEWHLGDSFGVQVRVDGNRVVVSGAFANS